MLVNERNASPVIRAWDKIPRPSLSLGFVNTTSIPSPPNSPPPLPLLPSLVHARAHVPRRSVIDSCSSPCSFVTTIVFPVKNAHCLRFPLKLKQNEKFLFVIYTWSPPSPPTRSLVTRNVTSKSFGIRSQSVQFPFIREGGGFIRR